MCTQLASATHIFFFYGSYLYLILFLFIFRFSTKRWNVIVTRAEALLIVIGDSSLLELCSFWKIFIDYVKANNGFIIHKTNRKSSEKNRTKKSIENKTDKNVNKKDTNNDKKGLTRNRKKNTNSENSSSRAVKGKIEYAKQKFIKKNRK